MKNIANLPELGDAFINSPGPDFNEGYPILVSHIVFWVKAKNSEISKLESDLYKGNQEQNLLYAKEMEVHNSVCPIMEIFIKVLGLNNKPVEAIGGNDHLQTLDINSLDVLGIRFDVAKNLEPKNKNLDQVEKEIADLKKNLQELSSKNLTKDTAQEIINIMQQIKNKLNEEFAKQQQEIEVQKNKNDLMQQAKEEFISVVKQLMWERSREME